MSSSRLQLKIGLIGCGKVAADHHLPSLQRLPRCEIVAVADLRKERLVHLAKKYSIATTYQSAAELIQDPRIQAVGVLTDTPSHHEIALAALRAGKHVFLEKPLGLSRQECDDLVAAGKASGKKTMVCFNLRWHRLIIQAKEILSSGCLGSIMAVRSAYTHFRDGNNSPDWHRKLCHGGGVTFNEAVHHIDLWRYLLKQEIDSVFAFHTPFATYEDGTSIINARLSGGTLASAINTFQTSPTSEIEIYGSKGRLVVCLYKFDGLRLYSHLEYPGELKTRVKGVSRTMKQLAGAFSAMKRGGGFGETFYHAWSHFIDSILSDRHPQCTFDDGRQAVLTTLAAIQSFQTNQLVSVASDNQLPCP